MIEFDPHDPSFVDEGVPFDVLARIRTEEPVYKTPRGAWYLSRYQDIEAALKDVETFREIQTTLLHRPDLERVTAARFEGELTELYRFR